MSIFSVKHITSRSNLPQSLITGRAYFIDDEGSVVIDHGNGPVTYGAKAQTDTNTTAIGTLSSLNTTSKSDLVGAVNEVLSHITWVEDNA